MRRGEAGEVCGTVHDSSVRQTLIGREMVGTKACGRTEQGHLLRWGWGDLLGRSIIGAESGVMNRSEPESRQEGTVPGIVPGCSQRQLQPAAAPSATTG